MAAEPTRGLFGRIAVSRGYCTQEDIDDALGTQARIGAGAPSLGALLVQRFVLSAAQVHEIMALQRQSELHPPPPEPPPPAPTPAKAAPAPAAPTAAEPRPTAALAALLESAEQRGASDVHLHAGAPIALRVDGRLATTNHQSSPADHEAMVLGALDERQREIFDEAGEVDFAWVSPKGLRARVNVYRTIAGVDATFRLVRRKPQTFEALGLPNTLARLVTYHQGLVLVTGPAGSGKSTTLAALVHLINEDRAEHILCIEDPIEIVHPVRRALVNQRQLGRDTESYGRALRGALREDPDVIVIGELRDRESIALAITAAETGHLVIGSMQTASAVRTISRLVDAFPPAQQGQVRAMLSESLRGIVSLRLVPAVNGPRVPAAEVLFVTPAVGNLIREDKAFQIRSVMQTGRALGMQTLDDALKEHVHSGRITGETARAFADDQRTFGGGAPAPAPAPRAEPPPPARPEPPPPPPARPEPAKADPPRRSPIIIPRRS